MIRAAGGSVPGGDTRRAWLLLAYLPAIWLVALRSALGMAALLAICLLSGCLVIPKRGDIPVILSVGALHMTAFSVLVSVGLQFVPVGRSVVLAYTTPLWVVPGARLLLDERLTVWRWLGITLGLLGLLLIFNPLTFDWHDRNAVLGNGLVLLAALCWAVNILYVRSHKWVTPPFELVFWQALLATCLLVPLALLLDGAPRADWQPRSIGLLTYGGVFGIALGYWAMTTANRLLPAATTSLGLLGVPVLGMACSAFALGEGVSLPLLGAMGLILGGIGVGTIK